MVKTKIIKLPVVYLVHPYKDSYRVFSFFRSTVVVPDFLNLNQAGWSIRGCAGTFPSRFFFSSKAWLLKLRLYSHILQSMLSIGRPVPVISHLHGPISFIGFYPYAAQLWNVLRRHGSTGLSNLALYDYRYRSDPFGTSDLLLIRFVKSFPVRNKSKALKILHNVTVQFRMLLYRNYYPLIYAFIASMLPPILIRKVRRGKEKYAVPYHISILVKEKRAVKNFLQSVVSRSKAPLHQSLVEESVRTVLGLPCNYLDFIVNYYDTIVASRIYAHFRW